MIPTRHESNHYVEDGILAPFLKERGWDCYYAPFEKQMLWQHPMYSGLAYTYGEAVAVEFVQFLKLGAARE